MLDYAFAAVDAEYSPRALSARSQEMLQTVWGSLFKAPRVQPGERLLIRGGTPSVGLAVATIAKKHGAPAAALLPVPSPKPQPRSLYVRYSASVPALRSAAIRRSSSSRDTINQSCALECTTCAGALRRIVINKGSAPPIAIDTLLPGADFTDAYSVHVAEPLDALEAARRMMERRPGWVSGLLMLRNLAVTPFGLKREAPAGSERIGIFPVVSALPEQVVMGFDDAHLDFRVAVEVTPDGSGQQVTATTFVRTRNRLGRLYLAAVKPFHRMIVPAMLAQVGRN